MEKIVSKNIWLWPPKWRLVFVMAKDKKFNLILKFGFAESKGKTYFVIMSGKIYIGLRFFSIDDNT